MSFSEEYLDPRGGSGNISKDHRVPDYFRENGDGAFFSKDIVETLEEHGVKTRDIMANVRRYERRGWVYVRGYKTDVAETPFRRGYMLTWLDQDVPRKQALADAIERTDRALEGKASRSPSPEPSSDPAP